jgi:hypothetical protein
VGVEFHPADPSGEGVKTVIEALVETLRERTNAAAPR